VLAFAHRLQALFLTLGSFGGEAVLATLMRVRWSLPAAENLEQIRKARQPFEKHQVTRKKRSTIGKGGGERLEWSDEDERTLAASRFLS
jgi:hypothetical protein